MGNHTREVGLAGARRPRKADPLDRSRAERGDLLAILQLSFNEFYGTAANVVIAGERRECRTIDTWGDQVLINAVVSDALISVSDRSLFEHSEHTVDLVELNCVSNRDLNCGLTGHITNTSPKLDEQSVIEDPSDDRDLGDFRPGSFGNNLPHVVTDEDNRTSTDVCLLTK